MIYVDPEQIARANAQAARGKEVADKLDPFKWGVLFCAFFNTLISWPIMGLVSSANHLNFGAEGSWWRGFWISIPAAVLISWLGSRPAPKPVTSAGKREWIEFSTEFTASFGCHYRLGWALYQEQGSDKWQLARTQDMPSFDGSASRRALAQARALVPEVLRQRAAQIEQQRLDAERYAREAREQEARAAVARKRQAEEQARAKAERQAVEQAREAARMRDEHERQAAEQAREAARMRDERRRFLENRLLDLYAEFAFEVEVAKPGISEDEVTASFCSQLQLPLLAPEGDAWLLTESRRSDVQRIWQVFVSLGVPRSIAAN